ncbi:cobaltochelatase subunit CobN [Pollutimonas bauzanensis]|uniref:Cobaltochelatase CobN n=1 Tax=Pollutimonas bauzanensis TaxID=658167 RepID=A0A1M5V593_9BURK|nr:cobaltochelatase subunit CobN [Pollutimonas bauzanensis]SHH70427.1 cobaltochelatase CobN [Pollutimonas bauzanensis]
MWPLIKRGFAAFALALGLCAPGSAAQPASVLFIATSNVPAGKFKVLADIARPHGLSVEVRYVNDLPADVDEGLFRGRDIVFIDSYQQDAVRARLAKALPGLRAPLAWVYDKAPEGMNMPQAMARRLALYYSNGGRDNFDAFFATTAALLAGAPTQGIAEPIVFPDVAVYHPKAPGLFFDHPLDYLKWKGVDLNNRPPVIGIAFHQQYVSAMQTRLIDDVIARVEAAGAVPLAYYSPTTDPTANLRMLAPDGQRLADVLINTRIMLTSDAPRREFEKLGIPVVQATPYRRGDAAAWEADPQGLQLSDVPFYMSQAEYTGIIDVQVASALDAQDQQLTPIPAQLDAVVGKALRLISLQRKANADKAVTVFFWNYPPGEKNLSASFLNVPRSMVAALGAMQKAGYDTAAPDETRLVEQLQRLLAPLYRDARLADLLNDGLAARLPVSEYRQWLDTLPAKVRQDLLERWGDPADSSMVLREGGEAFFVVPRLLLGKVAIMPQPPRSEKSEDKEKALYHSTTALPTHFYLAAYLWARQQHHSDAFIHFGTHGSQEWLPGKERGLSVYDYPMLAVGDVPVVYPYIADNIGEAQQARRRGRAVIVSHQTPPFQPAGMHDALTEIHDLLHQWLAQGDGAVRDRIKADILSRTAGEHIGLDMGWPPERAAADFPAFIDNLHAHLHELARMAQPLGLHTLGQAPQADHRLATVLLMLGSPFWDAAALQAGVAPDQLDEALVSDYSELSATAPYALLKRVLLDGQDAGAVPAELQAMLDQARRWYADIGAQQELPAVLDALAGRYIATSYGGDPIKNPEAYPTGRNLYGFDPSRVPTRQAWEAGKEAAEQLLAAHREKTGQTPRKITFSLWSVETMRHQGLLEAQALWLLGVEPVWDKGGRVVGVRLVERKALGRPRVDVVLSATGLYRDHFPNALKQLAHAAQLAALAREDDNPVAANAQAIAASLAAQGVAQPDAVLAGQTRIFSSASGQYGTGLDDATLATDSWNGKEEGDKKLAALYLSKMQFAYGPDEAKWGAAGVSGGGATNLYAEHLRGTEGAVLSRTSNTYGMLTTDDPFQYLGGIGLAVRSLDGKPPELYISNLRGGGSGKVEGAAGFLAKELATRQFHPGYIKALMAEGYSGTLSVLDATNNLWGWTAVAREVVRDDQWEEMAEVYVRDKYGLGLKEWFEKENPHALAQTMERMLEAARQEYWHADPATVDELKARYQDLAARFDVHSDNARFLEYVATGVPAAPAAAPPPAHEQASSEPAGAPPAAPERPQADQPTEQVSGMRLEKASDGAAADDHALFAALALLLLAFGSGALRQAWPPSRRGRRATVNRTQ